MIKNTLTILILIYSLTLSAQTINFNVTGNIKDPGKAKFAYLTTLQQIIKNSDPRIFMVNPIVNGSFEFKGAYDLQGKDYQYAFVFVDSRGNISREELESKIRNIVIVPERENNFRLIMLEKIELSIINDMEVRTSRIKNGGKLTKQVDELNLAIRHKEAELVNFVKLHPGSLVALAEVESVADFTNASNRDRMGAIFGTPIQLYNQLSQSLKSSKRGVKLRKIILAKQKIK